MDSEAGQRAYERWLGVPTDIQGHLSFLFERAEGNVVELGTRDGVSTAALLAGLERRGGHLWSVDVDPRCAATFAGHPAWTFLEGSSLDPTLVERVHAQVPELSPRPIDVLFVDTLHTRAHVYRELELWTPLVRPGGIVLVHDAVTFPGVQEALGSYAAAIHQPCPHVRPGSNGLGVLEVRW